MKRNIIEEIIMKTLMIGSLILIIGTLASILYSIFMKGMPALSWEMITQEPKGGYYFGKEGGVANAIMGSIYLAIGATLFAMIIGIPCALLMNVVLRRKKRLLHGIRFFMDVLWGIPSIVYGAFGFFLMLSLGMNTSLLAGIIVVGLFITPIMIRALDEVLQTVPIGLTEASYSLGMTKSETSYKVFIRKCAPGMVTAILLSFGRAIGDAAAVLFTTGYTDFVPRSLDEPTATLPLAIFFQLSSPIDEVKSRAYAAALLLTIIILIMSFTSRLFTWHFNKKNQ